jgi:hypothetical protein
MLDKYPNVKNIFTYLMTPNIPSDSPMVRIALYTSAVLIVVGVLIPYVSRKVENARLRIFLQGIAQVVSIGGLGWIILFLLRFEDLPPFDRRFWTYLWFIPVAILFAIRFKQYKKKIPVEINAQLRREKYDKYLPKPKRT